MPDDSPELGTPLRVVFAVAAAAALATARYWVPSIGVLLSVLLDAPQQEPPAEDWQLLIFILKTGATIAAGLCGGVLWWLVPRRKFAVFGGMLVGALSAVFSYVGAFVAGCLFNPLLGLFGTFASLLWTGGPALILLTFVGGTLGLIEQLAKAGVEGAAE